MYKKMLKMLRGEKGEVYVGEGVKIVLCVVLGAAILAGLVLMANKVILPRTGTYIKALFSSADGSAAYLEWDSNGRPSADKMIQKIFVKKAMESTGWKQKSESGKYDEFADQDTIKQLEEIMETGNYTITSSRGKTIVLPGELIVALIRENLKNDDNEYTPEQKQFYQDFINTYDAVNNPEMKRKAGTMTIELERKTDCIEDDVLQEYIIKYGGNEDAFDEYVDSLSDEEYEAFGLELEGKVLQKYRDTYQSVGAKYGVEFTEEEFKEMFE